MATNCDRVFVSCHEPYDFNQVVYVANGPDGCYDVFSIIFTVWMCFDVQYEFQVLCSYVF